MPEKMIAGGAWIQVLVKDEDGILKSIGLASGCSYDEDWAIQQANVLNHLGPVSLDSQGYTCTINMSAFVPEKKLILYADGGEITIEDLLPYRDDVQLDGKGKAFAQLLFMNTATNKVLRSFSEVVVASNGEQVSPNAYVTVNIRFMAIKRDRNVAAAA
jgi:hypothetical protein